MNRAKEIIVLLAGIAAIVACACGIILAMPPFLVAWRDLQGQSMSTAVGSTPTSIPVAVSVSTTPDRLLTETPLTLLPLPTLTFPPTYTPLPTLTSYPTQTRYPTQTPRIVVATAASPTALIMVPTPLPLGSAIIGALHNDGSLAAQSYETNSIELYPKTLVDAVGQLHGDCNKRIYAFPDQQTGLAIFSDLTPGVYVVCFQKPGGALTVGEITIKAYITVKQNFKWPPSMLIGSECKL